jgi:CheY-like chemotaxis protein
MTAPALPYPRQPPGAPERFSNRLMSILLQGLEQSAAHAAHAAQPEAPRARPTVLLAEDDRALRRYLEVVLHRAGYEVLPAADGLEAMKALLSNHVDAVVTDAIMPHLSGHELCRFLREHPQLKEIPVVLLSGADSSARPEEAGADLYLLKPVPADVLAASLARLVGEKE